MRGVLITVEGVEGSGKTTQCERLGQWLHARGFEVVLTSEPDGTRLGSAIRDLDAFEKMDVAFHRRVREGYLEIARAEKNRVRVLDAARNAATLHADVARAVEELLERRGAGRGA